MARRNFATVDALLILICVVIFAGGVLAQTVRTGSATVPPPTVSMGDKP